MREKREKTLTEEKDDHVHLLIFFKVSDCILTGVDGGVGVGFYMAMPEASNSVSRFFILWQTYSRTPNVKSKHNEKHVSYEKCQK